MGVLVVGMHRSGTSAIAGALVELGLTIGDSAGLMPAGPANPSGYFERQEIAELNEEILRTLGGAWDCPPLLRPGWEADPDLDRFALEISQDVSRALGANGYIVKDPRITLLLPLWRRAILDRCCAVLVVRDPAEVAWSLRLRDGLPEATGLALWNAYNRAALTTLEGLPVHVCSYEQLLSNPQDVLEDVVTSLVSWHELPADIDFGPALATLKPELRRNTWPKSHSLLGQVPDQVKELQKLLGDAIGRHDRFEGQSTTEGWWEQALFEERRQAHQIIRRARAETAGVKAELVGIQGIAGELQGRVDEMSQRLGELEHLSAELGLANARVAELEAERDMAQAEAAKGLVQVESLRMEVATWRDRWDKLQGRLPIRVYRAIVRTRSEDP